MNIFICKETHPGERRVPVLPATVEKLVKLGAQVAVEPGLGSELSLDDAAYAAAGAQVPADAASALRDAGLVLRLRKPPLEQVGQMARGAIHVSFLDPFRERDLVRALAEAGISAISLELLPRTTLAQKMDALSSQANLAGYAAVILAAERLAKSFPMMSTPAGTIAPARVFVIGAGVAGLQAIATAKRLGAIIEAFDTRPEVEEQVRSLGGRFVKVDLGETRSTTDGYARALTAEQLEKQRAAMARHCAGADVVITTAQVFGRPAPRIITHDMLQAMKPGSVVVDMAVETGGNVEGSRVGEEVDVGGVRVIGPANLSAQAAADASLMYSNNLGFFVEHFWDKETKAFRVNPEDELLRGCLVTHDGRIVNERIRELYEEGGA